MSAPSCTWCLYGKRRTEVPADHVALFACAHEHMTARPLCAACADETRETVGFICNECAAADVGEDEAVCYVTLVCTRAAWMRLLADGKVRFLRAVAS